MESILELPETPLLGYAMDMNAAKSNQDSLHGRVEAVLEAIRPAIQADGGDVELIDVTTDGVVQIRFLQACIGCPSAQITLKHGIESNLKAQVAGVTEVVAID